MTWRLLVAFFFVGIGFLLLIAQQFIAYPRIVGGTIEARNCSGRFQPRQIHLTVLTRERHLPSAPALVLMHAEDAMIAGVIQLDFAITRIDSQPLVIPEECITRFVLTAG
jgi:hypothetical protein